MIISAVPSELNTAILPIATHADVADAVSLVETIAATCSDDLLTVDEIVLHHLDRLAVASLSALLAVDRDQLRLSMADTAVIKRLVKRIGGLR